jgi:hypothetical protein
MVLNGLTRSREPYVIERLHGLPRTCQNLDQEAIPHASISEASREIFVVDAVGEAQIDAARLIEAFELLLGKLHIQTDEIVLELGSFPRSDDRDYRHGAISEPSEGDLRHAAAELLGNDFYGRDDPRLVVLRG